MKASKRRKNELMMLFFRKKFWIELLIVLIFATIIICNTNGIEPCETIVKKIGHYFLNTEEGNSGDKTTALISIVACFIGVFVTMPGIIEKYKNMSEKKDMIIELKYAFLISFSALTFTSVTNTSMGYYATFLLGCVLLSLTELVRIAIIVFKSWEEP